MSDINTIFSAPTERIFHIGRECYIIFVGQTLANQREFIRIGNDSQLPAEIDPHIEALVLTDWPLANPFLEQEIQRRLKEQHITLAFMGNAKTVRGYKRFLELSKVKFIKYQSISGKSLTAKVAERDAYIYFFENNALEVRLDNRSFFSLQQRAISDKHYTTQQTQSDTLLSRFSHPYRSLTQRQHSFFMAGANCYLTGGAALCALGLEENYYATLASRGFDPRSVQRVISGAANNALIRYLSPALGLSQKEKPPKVYLQDVASSKQIAPIPLRNVNFLALPAKGTIDFSTLKVIPHFSAGDPPTIEKFEVHTNQGLDIQIDITTKSWNLQYKNQNCSGAILEGIPYLFEAHTYNTRLDLLREYLPFSFDSQSHGISRSETNTLNTLLRILSGSNWRLLKRAFKKGRRLLRALSHHCQRYTYVALHNIQSLARVAQQELSANVRTAALFGKLYNVLGKSINELKNSVEPYSFFPAMQVEFCQTPSGIAPFIRYGWNSNSTVAAHDQEISNSIVALYSGPEQHVLAQHYKSERQRLLALLGRMTGKTFKVAEQKDKEESSSDATNLGDWSRALLSKGTSGGTKKSLRFKITVISLILLPLLVVGGLVLRNQVVRNQITDTEPPLIEDTPEDTPTEEGITDSDLTEEVEVPGAAARVYSEVWLSVDTAIGAIEVTIGDIVQLTNRIARESGFRELGDPAETGPDPDLIYPRNNLTIPPIGERYLIQEQDTIWGTAVRRIEAQIANFAPRVAAIREQLVALDTATTEDEAVQETARAQLLDALSQMEEQSYVASLTNRIAEIGREFN